jgi:hypothetical protein
MQQLLRARVAAAVAAAALAALTFQHDLTLRAATPTGGTLTPAAPLTWQGFPGPAASPDGEATCVDATNCDTFTFTIVAGNYIGKRVRFKISWSNELNDYDVYVHQGSNAGPEVGRSGDGAPEVVEENTFDVNTVVVAGVNDTYTVRTVYWAVGAGDAYRGVLTIEDIPASPTRTAVFVKGSKTGIRFSRNRTLSAPGAGQDVEPSARVDYKGNAYAGGIRGLTGGNDIWRFDLNPNSPSYDPFLRAATARFDATGAAANPAWKGQPDALSPDDDSDLGGDGGGDLDIAVGHKPPAGAPLHSDPIVAFSSLVAANVSTQRSKDRAETYDRNPAGNVTVPVDDRQWNEFLGGDVVYLGYRELAGLQATSKYYINRSDDGGLTYGPAVLAALGGNITGNIDVDQRDGTVYFCHQGPGTEGNKEVRVAAGQPASLKLAPVSYATSVAAKGANSIGFLFPVCKVASDGTVYVAYSDGGTAIFIAHSTTQGRTWSLPVRVSSMSPGSAALMPWIETGERPGSLAIVWYGADAADSEGAVPGNTPNANWKVYYAQTLNATAQNPTILQTVASDHVIHAADISTQGLVVGGPNRNLADFFQVAVDPLGLGFIAYADDSNDFAAHTRVTHQIAGPSLHTGKTIRITGKDAEDPIDPAAPEVMDFRHDARLATRPPTQPDTPTSGDIISIDYGCEISGGLILVTATMKLSALDPIPASASWRVNFATHPSVPGASDRADQWFLSAQTDAIGTRTFSYGTAVRNSDGSLTYTSRGDAAGHFDLTQGTITMKIDTAALNALQTRGAVTNGTVLMGTRGSAAVSVSTPAASAVVLSDATRGGRPFRIAGCAAR